MYRYLLIKYKTYVQLLTPSPGTELNQAQTRYVWFLRPTTSSIFLDGFWQEHFIECKSAAESICLSTGHKSQRSSDDLLEIVCNRSLHLF